MATRADPSTAPAGPGQGDAAASRETPLEPDFQHFLTTFLHQPPVLAAAAAAGTLPEGQLVALQENVPRAALPSVASDVAAPGRSGTSAHSPAISTPNSNPDRDGPQWPASTSGAARTAPAPEPASSVLRDEYWFLAGKLHEQQSRLLAEIQQIDSRLIQQQAAGGAHEARAAKTRRIMVEVHKRCMAEPGSAAAASQHITEKHVKLLRAVASMLRPVAARSNATALATAGPAPSASPAGAATAAAAPVVRTAAGVADGAEPPPLFICPITQELMHDPVVAADGHTYERKQIEEWMRRGQQQVAGAAGSASPRSPMTNKPLSHTAVVPNLALRSAIREWQEAQRRQQQERHQQESMQRRGSRPLA